MPYSHGFPGLTSQFQRQLPTSTPSRNASLVLRLAEE